MGGPQQGAGGSEQAVAVAGPGPDADPVRDRTEEIVEHLFALVERLRGGFEAAVAAFDLSAAQAKALRYVAHAGPVPMRDVADRLGCDASNVTGIVDRLEQRGLLQRQAAPADRRIKSLVVTRRGSEVAGAMWIQVMAGAVGVMGLAEEEQMQLLALLRRLDRAPSAACWVTGRSAG
ncbi:MAG TPA: MarR family transcriptional regulator [Acidimicrobiales bacterium]